METLDKVQLVPDPDGRPAEVLVGIGPGETDISEAMVAGVMESRRTFPHIVGNVALNRMRQTDPGFSYNPSIPPPRALLNIMGQVRDELLSRLPQR